MDSQLIVVDFTRIHRHIDFQELTGFTQDTVSLYRDQQFDDFCAYLFNYERWGSRPLLQVAFYFPELLRHELEKLEPTTSVVALRLRQWVKDISERYQAFSKTSLVVVEHKPNLTICGYTPLEKYPDLGEQLTWLVEPIQERPDAEPSPTQPDP